MLSGEKTKPGMCLFLKELLLNLEIKVNRTNGLNQTHNMRVPAFHRAT